MGKLLYGDQKEVIRMCSEIEWGRICADVRRVGVAYLHAHEDAAAHLEHPRHQQLRWAASADPRRHCCPAAPDFSVLMFYEITYSDSTQSSGVTNSTES